MGKNIYRYRVDMLKYPPGHGFRNHYSSTKKNAKKIAQKIGGKYRIVKLDKPKYI
jgi:hypothetical protein